MTTMMPARALIFGLEHARPLQLRRFPAFALAKTAMTPSEGHLRADAGWK